MFPLKALFSILIIALALVSDARAEALSWCGACKKSGVIQAKTASSISTTGEKKLLYIRLNYADDSAEPISLEAATTLVTEVENWFRQHSYGQFWLKSTISPLLALPSPRAVYFPKDEHGTQQWQPYVMMREALELAETAGLNPEDFELVILRFNAPIIQSFANIGSRGAWLVSSHPATTIHELGHNLGLQHADLWQGPVNGPGTSIEYGDDFDIMGNPPYYKHAGLNVLNKKTLGWIPADHVKTVAESGVYRLYAQDVASLAAGATFALRVRKDKDRDYWIEKRQAMDMLPEMEESGVLVYWNAWSGNNGRTQLIDPTGEFGEALPIGKSLVDPSAGITITPLAQAVDRSYVDLRIDLVKPRLVFTDNALRFSGQQNRTYLIQVSADLDNWIDLTEASSPSGEIIVPIQTDWKAAFYRVLEVPDLR